MPFCILSFDGGGICGLFTARILDRLVAEFPSLLDDAGLFAGTSTGGIIALCLAAGKEPADLVGLYRDEGPDIFDDSWWDDIVDLGNAVGADYNNKYLKKAVTRQLGANTRLRDLKGRMLVPSFDLDDGDEQSLLDQTPGKAKSKAPVSSRSWKPKFFHNFPGNDTDGNLLAVDVALRTSAAPTFFPAYQGYIDGGVVANNPSLAAIATALDPRAGKMATTGDIAVLSISTGNNPQYIKGSNLNWGWGQWARPLIQIMISGVMGVADFQARQILDDRYLRLDRLFDRAVNMDDTRADTLKYLVDEADALLDDNNGAVLKSTRAWLDQHWGS
jgi:patatin-like phospholipase/acyl hydrolase